MANGNALQKPLTPSAELSAVIGPGPHTRAEATSKLWSYIKDNGCQNPENRREIVADAKLRPIFDGAAKATMFEVPKHLNRHLT
jgi:chromatin remodeling complex protein RSC6